MRSSPKRSTLRRHIERVAAQRRALPPGGKIPETSSSSPPGGPRSLPPASSKTRARSSSTASCSARGAKRPAPCVRRFSPPSTESPSTCANASPSPSPLARPLSGLLEYQKQRVLPNLPFASDASGSYTRTYVSPEDADMPALNVFTRGNGAIHHFYANEMDPNTADPGQDPRGAPDLDPLWLMLDLHPRRPRHQLVPKARIRA